MKTKCRDFSGVWIFAEQRNGVVQAISFELLNRGRTLADMRGVPLTAVLLGPAETGSGRELVQHGADRVRQVPAPELAHFLPDAYARTMEALIHRYRPEILLAGATSTGRTLMPLLAVKCNTGLTADCTGLDIEPDSGNLIQVRPAIGGNIMATIKCPEHRPQMATVRPRSARPAPTDPTRQGEVIQETLDTALFASRIQRLGFRPLPHDTANLQEAELVVAGGRGMRSRDNFRILDKLAALLGGTVGASRDAVDRGWASYPHQVGLSGKTVAPKLYFAVGISGSVQHLAGMKTSATIVAINTNPDAQIFQVADYGIVADLFDVLPLLIEKLQARKEHAPKAGAAAAHLS